VRHLPRLSYLSLPFFLLLCLSLLIHTLVLDEIRGKIAALFAACCQNYLTRHPSTPCSRSGQRHSLTCLLASAWRLRWD
jgi:hypothetical protein